MTTIKVTPEQLISVSKQFELAQQTAITMNGQLLRQVSFMERFWDGITKEQFYYSFHISQKNMDDFVTLTDSIAKELRHHADKFRLADAEQGNMIGVAGSFPVLAASIGMMNTKGAAQDKPAYDYSQYGKITLGNTWYFTDERGYITQETAKATEAYKEAVKNGEIQETPEPEEVDYIQEQTKAAMEGYNLWTGKPIPKWQAAFIVIGGIAYNFQGIRSSHGVKLNRNLKLPSGSFRIPKEHFKNSGKIVSEPVPSAPDKPQKKMDKAAPAGLVQSRINVRNGVANVKGSGLNYALSKHGGVDRSNKSQFSISPDEIKKLLQSKDVVKSPVLVSETSGNYVRQVDVGYQVGNLPVNRGGTPTNVITIISDKKGNLVNTFPGGLDFGG
ncbi:WXG100 family type VII secretion target [Paenibacillus sp. RC21]|uniref:WXG100 family type VII secretion target n=1 Tax=Paenibacillus sp. RC21 TaxID=3156312 RepID=UPI0038380128